MSVLRSMTNADILAYKQLCSICYTYPDINPADEKSPEQLHYHRGVFAEDGRLLSAMQQIPFDVRFCGHTVKLAGIGGVVTDPTARSGGAVRKIFEADLPRLYEEGHVLSALYPFSFYFYGKFGYTWAEFWRDEMIPRSSLRKDLRKADEIIRVLPGEDDQGMQEIYDRYIADKNLAVVRSEQMWKDLRRGAPWEKLKHAYVLKVGGKAVAYWIGQMEKKGYETTVRMLDMAWTSFRGLEAIFAMLRGMNEIERIQGRAQSGFDSRLLVEEAYDIEVTGRGNAMVRVINAERALALLPAPVLPGSLTVEVEDEQIAANCGCFTIESDGFMLTVSQTAHETPDLKCDIHGLSALVAGRHSFSAAADAGIVELLNPRKKRFAELLFTERQLHMNRNF